jgi:hypothetical protein
VCVQIRTSPCGIDGETFERPRGLTGKRLSFGDKPVNFTEEQRKITQFHHFLIFFLITSVLISRVDIVCYLVNC